MNGKNLKIGLIIPAPFKYSETFFLQDCKTLKGMGYEVYLFYLRGREDAEALKEFHQILPSKELSTNMLIRSFQLSSTFIKLLLFGSKAALYRFFTLERKDGMTLKKIIQRIYTNSHFFRNNHVSTLIFGYGNLLIERENLAKAINANSIAFFQGADLGVFPLIKGKDCYKRAFHKLDKAVFRSKNLLRLASKHHFNSNNKHFFIYNKIDISVFTPKQEIGIVQNPIRLICVSRLNWRKSLNHLILATSELKNKGIDVELKIIGDGEEFEHLFYLTKVFDLEDEVVFMGALPYNKVRDQMKQSDVFIIPTLFESNCRVLLEAQAIGLMVISTNWEGAEEIVIHQKTGWLVPKQDPRAIADQVEQIMTMPLGERKAVAENAIQHVQKNFNLKDAPKDFEQLLEQ